MPLCRVHIVMGSEKLTFDDARATEDGMSLFVYREGSVVGRFQRWKVDTWWIEEAAL